jgi:transcriptional regulator with XRE-family HTH domain
MSPTPREIGMALKRLREANEMSQYALAEVSGVSREYIRRLEAGESDATLGTLQRLANGLNVGVMVLIDSMERLEALARAAIAGADGDLSLAMSGLAAEIERHPHLITCSWKELQKLGSEERRRNAKAVETAKRVIAQIPPLRDLPPNHRGRRMITYLAQGLADVVERASKN